MSETPEAFLRVRIDVPAGEADAAGALLLVLGATGIEERDEQTLVPEGESAPAAGRAQVLAWLEAGTDHEALRAHLGATLPADATLTLDEVEAEDWVEVVRSQVVPVELGQRLRIRATWHEPGPEDGREELVLDPGLAFGTGSHPTTALCLVALEEAVARHRKEGHAPSVLDLGCGSGILSIAALRLGADRALAIDNDPVAVEVTLENAERNGVLDRVEATTEGPEQHSGVWDLVAANIQLGVLQLLAPAAAARLAPGGEIFLSGLLEEQAAEARAAYEAEGLEHRETVSEGGWARVTLRRPLP
ncbi:MAG: 50S ribosomal protein L11 methyltransferase [Deltaproteobacteria bacterium]|nr:50S ribosomal protein L11 methyltransferase [Deltaproteobacteria bacterium]